MFSQGNLIRERYEIQALIGQGGMGAVYRVADRRLPGRLCALKVVLAEPYEPGAATEALRVARKQFLAEASTLARLDHPNLPKVSDYFSIDGYDCLVMDYVPGQDLQQCVQEARRQERFLSESDLLAWIDQLCDVLSYLHGQHPPIVHGDIKPANIKLTADGRIKLVDFGLVRRGDPDDPRTVTGSGLRGFGSLPYTALEIYAGAAASVDVRSDLYSLGATLYHLATNQTPAGAHDRFLDPAALRSPRDLNPEITRAFERAILAAMQPHPKDRPASVAAWRQLLPPRSTRPAGMTDESPEPAGSADWGAAWLENRRYALLAAGLLGLAALVTFIR